MIKERDNLDFAAKLLPALEKNNESWLSQRMTRFGLISCENGFENGGDDSPRFDNGPIIAVDMNSYLLYQMKATANIAEMLQKPSKSAFWNESTDELNSHILELMYDADRNLF